ncbi:MAG: hypothetical protein ACLGIZ_09510 [Acidimicrobiia bacterium]
MPDLDRPPAAWVFEVDPTDIDLALAFDDGEAMIQFEVADDRARLLGPGQVAHLWVQDRLGDLVPAGIYATGSVVGPVELVDDEDGERVAVVSVGFDSLRSPVDGTSLLAGDEFVGSPLHDGAAEQNPVPLDRAQADAIAANDLEPGPVATVLLGVGSDEAIALPALEVRLPDDTLLVVEGVGHDGWTVVRGTPGMEEVVELPEQHATFIDAVEYVAAAVGKAGRSLPVVDPDDGIEAVAIFDADGGVYAVLKEAEEAYTFAWIDDDGDLERLDTYASLKEAILLPVLDEELFGGM